MLSTTAEPRRTLSPRLAYAHVAAVIGLALFASSTPSPLYGTYRVLWGFVQGTFFRCSFHNWYPLRAMMLRMFGAKLGKNVRVRRTVTIEIPANLVIGDDVQIGDAAILYALGTITIGNRALISQYAHLCAGSHDYTKKEYPLLRPPIVIAGAR